MYTFTHTFIFNIYIYIKFLLNFKQSINYKLNKEHINALFSSSNYYKKNLFLPRGPMTTSDFVTIWLKVFQMYGHFFSFFFFAHSGYQAISIFYINNMYFTQYSLIHYNTYFYLQIYKLQSYFMHFFIFYKHREKIVLNLSTPKSMLLF